MIKKSKSSIEFSMEVSELKSSLPISKILVIAPHFKAAEEIEYELLS